MQFGFNYTFEDYKQLSTALYRRFWYGKLPVKVWLALGVLVFFCGFAASVIGSSGSWVRNWLSFVLFIVGGGVIGAVVGLWFQIRSFFKKQKLDGLRIQYDVRGDGIKAVSEQYDSFIKWDAIEAATASPGYRFLWINKLQGFAIPDRCFQDEAQRADFDNRLRQALGEKVKW